MKGKKGLDYIDWSISMGIFIVAVTALFVFLKPGARPEHDQDTLINIVEQQFIKETQWFVHETPLFIENFHSLYGTGSQVEIKVEADDIRFTAAIHQQPPNTFTLSSLPSSTIRVNCQMINCDNTRFKLFGTTNNPLNTTQMEVTCTHSNDPAVCKAVLGATVTYQGLQQNKIDILSTQDYNTIKNTWNYPLQKEFAIYQDNNKIIGGQEPTEQANIFVKELKMNRIDDQGIQTAITINIRVW